MSETLFPYYERELTYLRTLAQDFARQYPAAAGRLLLEPNRSGDPHIERLIESFAILAGRIHHKLDDEFPELTDALLGVLYPHYLAPVPSMAIVQMDVDPNRAQLPNGYLVDRDNRFYAPRVGDLACKFRSCYPVTLWPLEIPTARLQAPPFPPGLSPPPRTAAALRIQFDCLADMKFEDLSLETLRIYLSGENQFVAGLYELIFNHAVQVVFRSPDPRSTQPPIVLSPSECLSQVGFGLDEGLLPYPDRSFPGYRLLSEFFAFPNKFQFVDLGGWQHVCRSGGFGNKVEVLIFLNRTLRNVEQGVEASTFRLGCAPIINLFEQIAEPITLTQAKHEYRVVPDVGLPMGTEVYSVDAVTNTDPTTGTSTEFAPFYAFRGGRRRTDQNTFWHSSRRFSSREGDRGTDVYLSLVDGAFDPHIPAEQTLVVRTTCTNRNVPNQLQHASDRLYFELEAPAPISRVRCLRTPTPPLRPPLRRRAHWGLISHLSLNHLSLADSSLGREALQQILQLYDFSDPAAGQQQLAEINSQIVEGITNLSSRPVIGRTSGDRSAAVCRGVEVTLELDEQQYIGTGAFLFASVLERFLGLYVSINSFTQLVAKTKQKEGYFKKWPPRAGQQQLL